MRAALGSFAALSIAAALAGCGSVNDRMWVQQGPGNVTEANSREAVVVQRTAPNAPPVAPRRDTAAANAPAPRATAGPQPGQATFTQDAAAPGAYTQVTRYGDLYFLSGQIAIDLGTGRWDASANTEQQTRMTMENVRRILEAERLTMANVISVTIYLRTMNDYRAMNDAYETYFRSTMPARTVVEVSRLPRDAMVEIAVVAGR
jgi:2-iminobutanoate/2-iminopropanoate deaminase